MVDPRVGSSLKVLAMVHSAKILSEKSVGRKKVLFYAVVYPELARVLLFSSKFLMTTRSCLAFSVQSQKALM